MFSPFWLAGFFLKSVITYFHQSNPGGGPTFGRASMAGSVVDLANPTNWVQNSHLLLHFLFSFSLFVSSVCELKEKSLSSKQQPKKF